MDLYSNDIGAIQEGNMRSQSVMNANQLVKQHNDDLAGQIASIQSSQNIGDITEAGKDAFGMYIANNKMGNKMADFKNWKNTQLAANPLNQAKQQAQKIMSDPGSALNKVQNDPAKQTLRDTGDGIFESEGSLEEQSDGIVRRSVKSLTGISDEALDSAGKGLGELASVGMAGMDIYKDIKAGGIAGDNWASKSSNLLQIGGAIADVGGAVFPPLALLGGIADIASGVTGEIGDLMDKGKQDQATAQLKQKETQQTQVLQASAPTSTGRTS